MAPVREFLRVNSSCLEYYNFDDRPGKIFSGLEHCRSTIVIAERGGGTGTVLTSRYHRWYSRDRSNLFAKLQTIKWSVENGEIVPKIGTEIEKRILNKLGSKAGGKKVKDFLKSKDSKDDNKNGGKESQERKDVKKYVRIWYHNAPQYWIHAHPDEYLPKTEYYKYKEREDGIKLTNLIDERPTDQYVPLEVEDRHANILIALLNSSLFYWWFVIWSDGRHLLKQHIEEFPIKFEAFSEKERKGIDALVKQLMKNYELTDRRRINRRKGGYAIVLKEIIPKESVDIIDKIDNLLAAHYGFSKEEVEFIKQFDRSIRIGD